MDGHRKQNFLVERVKGWNKVWAVSLQPVIQAAVTHNSRMVVITYLKVGCWRLGCMVTCHCWWFSKFLVSILRIVFILSANVGRLKCGLQQSSASCAWNGAVNMLLQLMDAQIKKRMIKCKQWKYLDKYIWSKQKSDGTSWLSIIIRCYIWTFQTNGLN